MKQLLISLGFLCLMTACKKEAGEGGNSVIQGKILERTYTAFPTNYSVKAALEKDVYIIYGEDNSTFDDRTRTSFDGSFKFEFLRKGKYRIFVYSQDTFLTNNFAKEVPIFLDAEIKKNKSEVNLSTVTTINL